LFKHVRVRTTKVPIDNYRAIWRRFRFPILSSGKLSRIKDVRIKGQIRARHCVAR